MDPQTRKRGANLIGRGGYTLIELVVSSAVATLLTFGLASSLYISGRALDPTVGGHATSAAVAQALAQVADDVRLARRFSQRTATSLVVEVPDRDGDRFPETVRYSWSGKSGDPLFYQYNSEAALVLAADVRQFDVSALTRTLKADPLTLTAPPQVIFEEFTEAKLGTNNTSMSVKRPPKTATGDLLIAAIAIDSDAGKGPLMSNDWQQIVVNRYLYKGYYYVTLSVWWKIAVDKEADSYDFKWSNKQQAYAWVMRFTGHDPKAPIHSMATTADYMAEPLSPGVPAKIDNALILRLGGFDDDDIKIDEPGVVDHKPITMDASSSGTDNISGGAAYAYLPRAGDSGAATFQLTDIEQFVTATIAIVPEKK